MNLKEEARRIAEFAAGTALTRDSAKGLIYMACRNHEMVNCGASAIKFCTEQDTNEGIAYLEAYYGGVAAPGNAFSDIVFRIAWATLCVEALECLDELEQKEPNE